jgi:hypothetical protein
MISKRSHARHTSTTIRTKIILSANGCSWIPQPRFRPGAGERENVLRSRFAGDQGHVVAARSGGAICDAPAGRSVRAMARYDRSEPLEARPVETVVLRCEYEPCSRVWRRAARPGPTPRFCSDACKQGEHRLVRRMDDWQRAAHGAEQERRRRAWLNGDRDRWLQAEARLAGPTDQGGAGRAGEVQAVVSAAVRVRDGLEGLAAQIASAQHRGPVSDELTGVLYHQFRSLQAAAAQNQELLSEIVQDTASALQLVQAQIAALLADTGSPG